MTYCNASSQPTMLKDLLSATASQSISPQCWCQWTVGFYARHLTTYTMSITHQFNALTINLATTSCGSRTALVLLSVTLWMLELVIATPCLTANESPAARRPLRRA
ncbi:hypothetical protein EAE99_005747 [Botrytis elliptica]|nr:hypothetical protein EAE99_005747 [Botrytis elliptica]